MSLVDDLEAALRPDQVRHHPLDLQVFAKDAGVQPGEPPLHFLLPNLQQFSPFIDDEGVIRVGGRLSRMPDYIDFKHPIILPKNQFSSLVVRHSHLLTGHGGKVFTLNNIRQSGFFINCGVLLVKTLIF